MLPVLLMLALSATVAADDLPRGEVIESVTCQAAPSQSYVLYLPSTYTPARAWPVIYLFDAGGRGRNAVDRYRAAAEEYGYILAGSNNSRNGRPNIDALASMPVDVTARFHVDPKRVYTGGMSGGARVALGMALDGHVAGVFAASAGYPDAAPRKTVPFAIFATTGTEDFNHLELRTLDRELTSPHRLTVFEGGHAWPPAALVLDGVEWMDLQAMKSRLKPRDEREIDAIFAKRLAAAGIDKDGRAAGSPGSSQDQYLALQDLVADFTGLREVSALAKRAAALGRDAGVRDALTRGRDQDDRERAIVAEVQAAEGRLEFSRQRNDAMVVLLRKWEELTTAANKPEDSAERRLARRVSAWLNLNTMTMDEDYRAMVREIRTGRGQ